MSNEEYIRCGNCQGKGVIKRNDNGSAITCPRCMGSGKVKNPGYKPAGPASKNPFR